MNVILTLREGNYRPYALYADGSINTNIMLKPPALISDNNKYYTKYFDTARHALVKDELYIFGGWEDRHKVLISLLNGQ